jgi:hypothetical protein
MLGTHTHVLSDRLHILTEHIVPINVRFTVCGLQHAGHHLDCGGFASTIVAKECKNLPLVHADVDSVYSFESIAELLFKVDYFKEATFLLQLKQRYLWIFKVFSRDVFGFKFKIWRFNIFPRASVKGFQFSVLLGFYFLSAQIKTVPITGLNKMENICPVLLLT